MVTPAEQTTDLGLGSNRQYGVGIELSPAQAPANVTRSAVSMQTHDVSQQREGLRARHRNSRFQRAESSARSFQVDASHVPQSVSFNRSQSFMRGSVTAEENVSHPTYRAMRRSRSGRNQRAATHRAWKSLFFCCHCGPDTWEKEISSAAWDLRTKEEIDSLAPNEESHDFLFLESMQSSERYKVHREDVLLPVGNVKVRVDGYMYM